MVKSFYANTSLNKFVKKLEPGKKFLKAIPNVIPKRLIFCDRLRIPSGFKIPYFPMENLFFPIY